MKLEPSEDTIWELSSFVDDVCHVKDVLETSPHPFRSKCSTFSKFAIKMCHNFHCNVGMQNSNKCVGILAPKNSTLECKVCQFVPICIVACNVLIVYVHFFTRGMSRACMHLGFHGHHVSNASCHEYVKIAYWCVANEVMKTRIAKKKQLMATSKQLMEDDFLISITRSRPSPLGNIIRSCYRQVHHNA